MSRLACALLALVAAAGVAAWPFEAKTGLPLNASKLPAYLTGNNTAAFKQGVAQAKEKLNATGLFNTGLFYLPPILEETASGSDPRIGVIDSIDEPPLDSPIDPCSLEFEFTPRSCRAFVYCAAGTSVTTYDAGCDPVVAGDNMFFVDAVTGVALPSLYCPGPGIKIPQIVIEVRPSQNYTCWATNTCDVVPPPTLPSDPTPDPLVPINTPSPDPLPPQPTTVPPAPPVGNITVPGQRLTGEGGTCTYDNGTPGTCLPAGSTCPSGQLPVAGDRNGKCPSSGVCCAPDTSLCRCNNSSNKNTNCGFYEAQSQGLGCLCVDSSTVPQTNNCGSGCIENGCNSVIGGRAFTCSVACRAECHTGIPVPGAANCAPARG